MRIDAGIAVTQAELNGLSTGTAVQQSIVQITAPANNTDNTLVTFPSTSLAIDGIYQLLVLGGCTGTSNKQLRFKHNGVNQVIHTVTQSSYRIRINFVVMPGGIRFFPFSGNDNIVSASFSAVGAFPPRVLELSCNKLGTPTDIVTIDAYVLNRL